MNKRYETQRKGTHLKRKETLQKICTYFLVSRNKLKSNFFYIFISSKLNKKRPVSDSFELRKKKLSYKFCHQKRFNTSQSYSYEFAKSFWPHFSFLQTFLRPWTVVINILCHLKAGLGIRSLDFRANHLIFWAKEQIISESLTSPFFKERQERIALLL